MKLLIKKKYSIFPHHLKQRSEVILHSAWQKITNHLSLLEHNDWQSLAMVLHSKKNDWCFIPPVNTPNRQIKRKVGHLVSP